MASHLDVVIMGGGRNNDGVLGPDIWGLQKTMSRALNNYHHKDDER
jgi:hypothetical protein